MNKWNALFLMAMTVAGSQAMETTIACAKNADQVVVTVQWPTETGMGYRLYGSPDIVYVGWSNLSAQVATPGLFQATLSQPRYFFKVEDYALVAPSTGMVLVSGGTNSGTDPSFGSYSLSVDSFWMDSKEVSKEKWDEVALWASNSGYNISTNKGASKAAGHPVQFIYYIDSILYCNAKSEMEGLTPCYTDAGAVFRTYDFLNPFTIDCDMQANGYRLPTSAEWEYAARGGLSGKRFPWGDTITHANANYYAYYNSPAYPYDATASAGDAGPHPSYSFVGDKTPYTAPVGDLPANGYGLYNISGNVAEFTNPDAAITKSSTIYARGGSWHGEADKARCGDKTVTASWLTSDQRYGFRTVVSVP